MRKLAKDPIADALKRTDSKQPRWAAKLLESRHRANGVSGTSHSQIAAGEAVADTEESSLKPVQGFPVFQQSGTASMLLPAHTSVSSKVRLQWA